MFIGIYTLHILICLGIIGLVLIQQGKGAEAGAIFGSSSESVLGPGSAPSFMTKLTTGMAIAFMLTSIFLVKAYMSVAPATQTVSDEDILKNSVIQEEVQPEADSEKVLIDDGTEVPAAEALADDEGAAAVTGAEEANQAAEEETVPVEAEEEASANEQETADAQATE